MLRILSQDQIKQSYEYSLQVCCLELCGLKNYSLLIIFTTDVDVVAVKYLRWT